MSAEQEYNWYKQADQRVGEFAESLREIGIDLPDEVDEVALALAEVVGHETTDWAATRPPKIIAAGCLYIADTIVRGDDRMTQRELEDGVPVTAAGVRDHYHDIPEVFLENAPTDYNGLDDETIVKLQMFRDAERAGFGLANVNADDHDPDALRGLARSIETVRRID